MFNQRTVLTHTANYKIIDLNNEELMIAKLLEGICLCTSFYLFKEFEEYKHGQYFVYEGTSTNRVNNGCSRHTVVIIGCAITPNTGEKDLVD